jgi:hypothetical protein
MLEYENIKFRFEEGKIPLKDEFINQLNEYKRYIEDVAPDNVEAGNSSVDNKSYNKNEIMKIVDCLHKLCSTLLDALEESAPITTPPQQQLITSKGFVKNSLEFIAASSIIGSYGLGVDYILTKQTGMGLINYGATVIEAIANFVSNPASAPILQHSLEGMLGLGAMGLVSSVLMGIMFTKMHQNFKELDKKFGHSTFEDIAYKSFKYRSYITMFGALTAPIIGIVFFPMAAASIAAISLAVGLGVGIEVDIAHHVNIDQGSLLSYPKAKFESLCFRGSSREIG